MLKRVVIKLDLYQPLTYIPFYQLKLWKKLIKLFTVENPYGVQQLRAIFQGPHCFINLEEFMLMWLWCSLKILSGLKTLLKMNSQLEETHRGHHKHSFGLGGLSILDHFKRIHLKCTVTFSFLWFRTNLWSPSQNPWFLQNCSTNFVNSNKWDGLKSINTSHQTTFNIIRPGKPNISLNIWHSRQFCNWGNVPSMLKAEGSWLFITTVFTR